MYQENNLADPPAFPAKSRSFPISLLNHFRVKW